MAGLDLAFCAVLKSFTMWSFSASSTFTWFLVAARAVADGKLLVVGGEGGGELLVVVGEGVGVGEHLVVVGEGVGDGVELLVLCQRLKLHFTSLQRVHN